MAGAASSQLLGMAAQANAETLARTLIVARMTRALDALIAELRGPAYIGASRLVEIEAQLTQLRLDLATLL